MTALAAALPTVNAALNALAFDGFLERLAVLQVFEHLLNELAAVADVLDGV